jgi:valine--pyruvate aminotransferase
MQLSKFGSKFTRPNGISQLMDDLGNAKNSKNPNIIMLGGGNPAVIPEVNKVFVSELQQLVESTQVDSVIGLYDHPQGNQDFRVALSHKLNEHYAWDIDENNIALSNGSQANFFVLFNLFAGEMPDGTHKKILFPLAPEYVGYADQGLAENMFIAIKPDIEILNTETKSKQFKYVVDFEAVAQTLASDNAIGALCVSRPTNPTGNVITDKELKQLDTLAQQYNIPLIVDNAYGHPFPGCIYTDATLTWNSNIILCMSLSKLGLAGLRTGIVIANQEIVQALGRINGSMILTPNSLGPALLTRMIKDKELLNLCKNVVKPYYSDKSQTAIRLFNEIFADMPVYLHKVEGAFFMWLWFKDAKISCETLYRRLKEKDVYIIPGHNFFISIEDDWPHKHECIRINYATDETNLRKGLEAIKLIMCEQA